MEKTKLESKALKEVINDAVQIALNEKKLQYEDEIRYYIQKERELIKLEEQVKTLSEEQTERELNLGITALHKKELF